MSQKDHFIALGTLLLVLAIGGWFWFQIAENGSPLRSSAPRSGFRLSQRHLAGIEELEAATKGKHLPSQEDATLLPPAPAHEHIFGSRKTPYSVILYLGIDNEFSRLVFPVLKNIVSGNRRSVNLIVRHYPVANRPLDLKAAIMSECIFEQKAEPGFWSFLEQSLNQERLSETKLLAIAEGIGVKRERLGHCMRDPSPAAFVDAQKQDARKTGKLTISPSVLLVRWEPQELRFAEGANADFYFRATLDAMGLRLK